MKARVFAEPCASEDWLAASVLMRWPIMAWGLGVA